MDISTKTKIAGIEFDSYVCNASGPKCTTVSELKVIGRSGSSAMVMKTCTLEPREGNIEPRMKVEGGSILQSMGLPNPGLIQMIENAKSLVIIGKPVFASVSGSSVEDAVIMVDAFQNSVVDMIEVNVSCPNIKGKRQIGYDFEQTKILLSAIKNLGRKPIGLKLPLYHDTYDWDVMSKIILENDIAFITSGNSLGHALFIDVEEQCTTIAPNHGFGGLSGASLLPISLANVHAFYTRLKGEVSIFGCGGVMNGADAFKMLLAGADAVQVATAFELGGTDAFSLISTVLETILRSHGYSSVKEAKGQLKYR